MTVTEQSSQPWPSSATCLHAPAIPSRPSHIPGFDLLLLWVLILISPLAGLTYCIWEMTLFSTALEKLLAGQKISSQSPGPTLFSNMDPSCWKMASALAEPWLSQATHTHNSLFQKSLSCTVKFKVQEVFGNSLAYDKHCSFSIKCSVLTVFTTDSRSGFHRTWVPRGCLQGESSLLEIYNTH